jgi:hypothetical protein
MADLDDVRRIASADGNLAVLAVGRRDGSVQASVASAGSSPIPSTARWPWASWLVA